MRRLISITLPLSMALALLVAPTAAAAIPPSFVLGGAGWGHGVGLSQYGAKGMAEAGNTAAQILSHYYTGTTVAPLTDNMDIRVQVHQALTMTANTTGGLMQIRIGTGAAVQVPAGTLVSFAVVGTGRSGRASPPPTSARTGSFRLCMSNGRAPAGSIRQGRQR